MWEFFSEVFIPVVGGVFCGYLGTVLVGYLAENY